MKEVETCLRQSPQPASMTAGQASAECRAVLPDDVFSNPKKQQFG
jgi:hypothetical protein